MVNIRYEAVLVVDPELGHALEQICNVISDEQLPRGEAIFDEEVVFIDGMRMAIQVVTTMEPDEDPCWTQGVLFLPSGPEQGCTDVMDSFLDTEFVVGIGSDEYSVTVVVR